MGPCANARKGPEASTETLLNDFRVCSAVLSAKNMHYFYHKEEEEKAKLLFKSTCWQNVPRVRPVKFLDVVIK